MITEHLAELVAAALQEAAAAGEIPAPAEVEPEFERPKRKEHGDWATNVALKTASGSDPRAIAQGIVDHLSPSDMVAAVEIAGPGFLNFRLSDAYFHDGVRRAADPASSFGRTEQGQGRRMNVEYVSANPTGPINVVSGRHAAVGDAIAALLAASGHSVTKEFYANDSGTQTDLFGVSIAARYLELFGRKAEIPEGGYEGDYIVDLATDIKAEYGDRFVDMEDAERASALRDLGLTKMMDAMKTSLQRFGTTFDVWASQRALEESGAVEAALAKLEAKGFIYEKDGARWFRSTEFGDDKDRVIVRANGEPTYLAADVAYLEDKFARGFEHLIYLWGADHHGTVARLLGAAEALGFDRGKVEVRLLQIVTLIRSGEAVKASKRAGVLVPLDELLDEVGADAARYTFLTRSIDSPLEFDIDLAKEQAPENPVYYVQYAHARISSILRKAVNDGISIPEANADLSVLDHASERELMRKLAAYEDTVPEAAFHRAPQRIASYAEELASAFSAFYRDCRVVSDDAALTQARLALCVATRRVIADALGLLGVGAPEEM